MSDLRWCPTGHYWNKATEQPVAIEGEPVDTWWWVYAVVGLWGGLVHEEYCTGHRPRQLGEALNSLAGEYIHHFKDGDEDYWWELEADSPVGQEVLAVAKQAAQLQVLMESTGHDYLWKAVAQDALVRIFGWEE